MSGGIFVIALLFICLPGDAHGELDSDLGKGKKKEIDGHQRTTYTQVLNKNSVRDLARKPNMTHAIPLGVRFRRASTHSEIPSEQQEFAEGNEVFAIRLASNDVQSFQNSNEVFLTVVGEGNKHCSEAASLGGAPSQVCISRGGIKTAAKWSQVAGKSANAFYLKTNSRKPQYLAVVDTPSHSQHTLDDSTPLIGLTKEMSQAIEWRTVSVDEQLMFLLVVRDHSNTGSGAAGLFLSTHDDALDGSDGSDGSKGLKLVLRSYLPVGVEFKPTGSSS